MEELYGNTYETFTASVSELGAKQKFYFRRIDDTMIVMTFTIFGDGNWDEILALGKEM